MGRWKEYFDDLKTYKEYMVDRRQTGITKTEIRWSVKQTKTGKAPGHDRITSE